MNNAIPARPTTTTPHPSVVNPLDDVNVVDAVNFINNAITLSSCRMECHAEKNDHIFTSNFVNIKNCTILCTPPPEKMVTPPEAGYSFNASNISENFNNVQGSNFNFSYNPSERKIKKPTVLVDDERYISTIRGDN